MSRRRSARGGGGGARRARGGGDRMYMGPPHAAADDAPFLGGGLADPEEGCSELARYDPGADIRCNILFFGPFGGGKSALINTLISGFGQIQKIAKVRGAISSQDHCTLEYDAHECGPSVRLFDPWGWDKGATSFGNFPLDKFVHFLDGEVPLKTERETEVVGYQKNPANIIDAVVFVLPAGLAAEELGVEGKVSIVHKMKPYMEACQKRRPEMPFLVAITKMDEYMKRLEGQKKIRLMQDPDFAFKLMRGVFQEDLYSNILVALGFEACLIPVVDYNARDRGRPDSLVCLSSENLVGELVALIPKKEVKKDFVFNMFAGEEKDAVSCAYQRSSGMTSIGKIATTDSLKLVDDPAGEIVCGKTYFKLLKLGKDWYRLFVTSIPSMKSGDGYQILGLFDPTNWRYFEMVTKIGDLPGDLDISFSRQHATFYEFLSDDGGTSMQYVADSTKMLRLNLQGGAFPLVLRQCPFTHYHSLVESSVQSLKEMSGLRSNVLKRQADLEEEFKQRRKELENDFVALTGRLQAEFASMKEKFVAENMTIKKDLQAVSTEWQQQAASKLEALKGELQSDVEGRVGQFESGLEGKIVEKFKVAVPKIKEDLSAEFDRDPHAVDPFKESVIVTGASRVALYKLIGIKTRWELIYSGAKHGFAAANFHTQCDGKMSTLTIIHSNLGNIFGGYNPIDWNGAGAYAPAPGAFLFGLNATQVKPGKLFPQTAYYERGLYRNSSYGPTFGSTHDLCLNGNIQSNDGNTYTNMGSTYGHQGLGAHCLNGGTNSFSCTNIEVWQKMSC